MLKKIRLIYFCSKSLLNSAVLLHIGFFVCLRKFDLANILLQIGHCIFSL